jgi:hypothetical protein
MKRAKVGVLTLLLAPLGFVVGCGQPPEGWTPVMEETSTTFLEEETERVLGHVRNAMQQLSDDPSAVSEELQGAASALEHLLDYYLPLVRAREEAYNAYRMDYLGDHGGVGRALVEIEGILTAMAEEADGQRLQEIESLAEALASARMATASGTGEGREALEALARHLNQAAVKGDLVLRR